ncbi:MAG: methyltransferase domain-containing protein [Pseudomonadota bacterium]
MTTANRIFDAAAVRRNRQRSSSMDKGALFLHQSAAESLIERRRDIARDLPEAAIHGGRGLVRREDLRVERLLELDSAPGLVPGDGCVCEPDFLPLKDGAFDAVFSLLSLHTVNDLPGSLIQINRALKPDGIFMAALFSIGTLEPVRSAFLAADSETTGGASPRVAPFVDVRDAGALLQRAGFVMPVADTEDVVVRYSSPLSLMSDLRAMGEANALTERSRRLLRRDTLGHALATLEALRDADGKIPVQFCLTFMTGWAPGPDQPKPLAPGSAKTRLADALGTTETKLANH